MKTRNSLVSNSSSTSFIVHTGIKDEVLRGRLWNAINKYSRYIEPEIYDPTKIFVNTGVSDGNTCLYNWWCLKQWFIDHNIEHEDTGDGTPGSEQKACDFVSYIVGGEDDDLDPLRVLELKHWLTANIVNKRIEKAAKLIGITKEEIKNATFNRDIIDSILGEVECQQK